MPVQINEVIIKAVVDTTPTHSTATPATTTSPSVSEEAIAAMVMEIIKEKNER